jgi:hypothetical protein
MRKHMEKQLVDNSYSLPAGNPTTTHRLEQTWHYTYSASLRGSRCSLQMVCYKPKHVGAYIVLI